MAHSTTSWCAKWILCGTWYKSCCHDLMLSKLSYLCTWQYLVFWSILGNCVWWSCSNSYSLLGHLEAYKMIRTPICRRIIITALHKYRWELIQWPLARLNADLASSPHFKFHPTIIARLHLWVLLSENNVMLNMHSPDPVQPRPGFDLGIYHRCTKYIEVD